MAWTAENLQAEIDKIVPSLNNEAGLLEIASNLTAAGIELFNVITEKSEQLEKTESDLENMTNANKAIMKNYGIGTSKTTADKKEEFTDQEESETMSIADIAKLKANN